MRPVRVTTVTLVVIASLGLAGCGASHDDSKPTVLDAVTVEGRFGSAPNVKMPTPIVSTKTACTTVIPGSKAPLEDGQLIEVELSIYNGSTGKLIEHTSYNGTDAQGIVLSDSLLPGLRTGLACATKGARVAMVIPPADAFKDAGNAQWGISATDNLVIVADVTGTNLARANGTSQLSQDGMPMVVLAPNGQPGVTMPKGAPSATERISTLLKGSGTLVQSGDRVTVHYSGFLWDGGTMFDSSWSSGKPVQFVVGDGVSSKGDVIQGFSNALIGQTVGSQVLAVIPPDLGYGAQGSGSIPANATLVFVVDILGVN